MWRAILLIFLLCSCNRSEELKRQEEIQREIAERKRKEFELKCAQERDLKRKTLAAAYIDKAYEFLEENKKDQAREVLMMVYPGNRNQKWEDLYQKAGGVLTDGDK